MTPEERAVRLCPAYDEHYHGNADAMGKCCDGCQPIADAIRAAVTDMKEQAAKVAEEQEMGPQTIARDIRALE